MAGGKCDEDGSAHFFRAVRKTLPFRLAKTGRMG